jgi:uncharacterized protein (TIGR02147 family)
MTNQKPNARQHTNIVKFLNEYFDYRKKQDRSFSYDIWAAELGFKSRIFMYLICNGKRAITVQFVNKFSDKINLTAAERNHLVLLASYHKAKSPELKSVFLDKILESLDVKETTFNVHHYQKFISSPTMPLVKMILSFDDIKGSIEEVSEVINMTETEIKKDLTILEKLGLVQKVANSKQTLWKATSKAFKVPNDLKLNMMKNIYHRDLIEAQNINKQSDVFKKFRTILFAINPEEHAGAIQEIEKFVTKMKNKYGYNNIQGKHILKLNMQAYPVTKVKS